MWPQQFSCCMDFQKETSSIILNPQLSLVFNQNKPRTALTRSHQSLLQSSFSSLFPAEYSWCVNFLCVLSGRSKWKHHAVTHHIHRSTVVSFCIVWKLYGNNNTLFNADLQMVLLKMYWLYRLRCASSATCHPNWVSPPSLHRSLCLSSCTLSASLPESSALCLGILIELQSSTCYRQSPCSCILLLQIFSQFAMNVSTTHWYSIWHLWFEIHISSIGTPFSDHRPHVSYTTSSWSSFTVQVHHFMFQFRTVPSHETEILQALPCSQNVNSLHPKVPAMSALIIGNTIWSDCSPAVHPFPFHSPSCSFRPIRYQWH